MAVLQRFIEDKKGDAVVEAAILFPIMIMIFAALVLLAIYLPTRSALQRATQFAATAIATENSDTWLFFDEGEMSFYWETDKNRLQNVYVALLSGSKDVQDKGEDIVMAVEGRSISSKSGELTVQCYIINKIIYREVVVIASREFKMPVDLSFIRFHRTIPITVTSTAVVQTGKDYVSTIDMAVDMGEFLIERFNINLNSEVISEYGGQLRELLGW